MCRGRFGTIQLARCTSDYDMILGPLGTNFMTVMKRLKRQQAWMQKNNIKVTLPALMSGQIELNGNGNKREETANANS